MMYPDPSSRPVRGGLLQLILKTRFHQRPVPPRTDREKRVADGQAVAVAGNPELADLADPARDFFALRAPFVEVVIAGAEDDLGDPGQKREILLYHHDLGTEIHERADVERIAGKDHKVELRRSREQPV